MGQTQRTSSCEREEAERSQRRQELAEIAKARGKIDWDEAVQQNRGHEIEDEDPQEEPKSARARELRDMLAQRAARQNSKDEEKEQQHCQRGEVNNNEVDVLSHKLSLERTKDQRARELQEIAAIRSQRNCWEDDSNVEAVNNDDRPQWMREKVDLGNKSSSVSQPDNDPLKSAVENFQNVADSLKNNEQNENQFVPSRGIGNMFDKNSDYWSNSNTGEEENSLRAATASPPPPPPPMPPSRDSSREFMAREREVWMK